MTRGFWIFSEEIENKEHLTAKWSKYALETDNKRQTKSNLFYENGLKGNLLVLLESVQKSFMLFPIVVYHDFCQISIETASSLG